MSDWNERYRRGEHASAQPHQLLVKTLESLSPGRALDLACGAGRNAVYLASKGWEVTAVDNSSAGIEIAHQRSLQSGVDIQTVLADLERGEFVIQTAGYDLICVFYYLQRDLFPRIKAGLQSGGTFVAAIHIVDDEPDSHAINPLFLLQPGELRDAFIDWDISYYHEGRIEHDHEHKHRDAEIVARRPGASAFL